MEAHKETRCVTIPNNPPNKNINMKKNVKYSAWCWFWTALSTAIIVGVCIKWINDRNYLAAGVVCGAFAVIVISSLIYAPLYVKVTDKHVAVRRPLTSRVIRMDEIASAVLCPPTMAERRICGSGGWLGYWGWFSERDLGKYFAYYGRSSDCFLLTLKNGRKYVIGCVDAPDVVETILRHI